MRYSYTDEVTVIQSRRRQAEQRRRVLFIAFLLVGSIAVSAAGYWWYTSRVASPPLDERVHVLVLGLDYVPGATARRSDTIFVASLREGDVRLLAIPRDTHVKFPDGRVEKVNAAYAFGGAELARKVISTFLGIEIKYYIVIDYDGFEKLVDLMGGVTLNVEKPLKDDKTKPPIDIAAGTQKLNGKMALGYIRYRDNVTGDLGRLQRQRQLIEALLRQGVREKSLNNLQQLVTTAQQYIETNLAPVSLYRLAQRLQTLRPEQVQIKQIPGESVCKPPKEGGCYIEPDPVRTAQLVNKMLRGMEVVTADEVRVKVLNGSGVTGIARRVAELLRNEGFSVVHVGNADRFDYTQSYIIDITGDAKKIELLRERSLRSLFKVVKPEELSATIKGLATKGVTGDGADVILIIGQDFQSTQK
uniref:Cell envelope-related transcriptional attenuator n=1 Tax=Acetithermum autotrophicum TaxID=1446466 RepID=H5SRB6_ACEAU|nr:cell envelope-related transcriptional attenuator [Candidatus Acetothermum autotrophicum]